jgi:hypothetical protein
VIPIYSYALLVPRLGPQPQCLFGSRLRQTPDAGGFAALTIGLVVMTVTLLVAKVFIMVSAFVWYRNRRALHGLPFSFPRLYGGGMPLFTGPPRGTVLKSAEKMPGGAR